MPVLEAVRLCKEFTQPGGKVTALQDVSLRFEAGDLVVITGDSGSGKTTLLSLLGLIDSPTRGSVRFRGRPLESVPPSELAAIRLNYFGFVFQDFLLVRHLTALDNVRLPLAFSGRQTRGVEERRLLERLGLGHRLHHRPDALSRGEMQRVALARALITGPIIVFADEPTANLDRDNSELVWGLLREFNRNDGLTLVVATHRRDLAREASQQIHLNFGGVVPNAPR